MSAEWQSVWDAVDVRREELGMSLTDLYRISGVSETTFRKMRYEGVPLQRGPKRAALCEALKWTRDSLERILAGVDPEPNNNGGPLEFNEDSRLLLAELAKLGAELNAMREEYGPTAQRVAEAAETLRGLREQVRAARQAIDRLAARVSALEGEGPAPVS